MLYQQYLYQYLIMFYNDTLYKIVLSKYNE